MKSVKLNLRKQILKLETRGDLFNKAVFLSFMICFHTIKFPLLLESYGGKLKSWTRLSYSVKFAVASFLVRMKL